MYLDNKLVFLAGATGCVGYSIAKYILENYPAAKIRGVYHRHTKPFIKHNNIEYVQGDLRDKEQCGKLVKGCDCAIMAAANTGGSNVITSQHWGLINDNVSMNLNMLETFHLEDIQRVLYIGSATLYQEYKGFIKEDKLDFNQDPYSSYFGIGWGVRFIEKMCSLWSKQTKREMIIIRAANIFGPYMQFNPDASNFIAAIIRKAVDKIDPFEVWGSSDVTRDVIYSDDFSKAAAMLFDKEQIKFDVFNIGQGIETTIDNVVKLALKYAEHNPREIKYNPNKPATIKYRMLDSTKINKLLEWNPQYSVEEGIRHTTKWWIENKGWWDR